MSGEIEPRYFVEAAAKALDVLESFNSPQEELSIAEIVRRAGITYCSTFRLLYTLEKRGYVMRSPGSKRYRLVPSRKRFRVGYAALDSRCPFSEEVTRSMTQAARAYGIGLTVKDNELSPARAIANADALLDERVHLLIMHQPHESAAGLIAARCREAKVPLVAVDFAHPGSYYFGTNYHRAGKLGGEYLRSVAHGRIRLLVVAPAPMNEALRAYARGLAEGLRPGPARGQGANVIAIGGKPGDYYRRVKQVLKEVGAGSGRVLVAAASDSLALACARALASLGCGATPLVGLGGSAAAITGLRKSNPRAAAIASFPEIYGDRVMQLALRILEGEQITAASYTEHVLLTAVSLNQYYPDSRAWQRREIPDQEPWFFEQRIATAV